MLVAALSDTGAKATRGCLHRLEIVKQFLGKAAHELLRLAPMPFRIAA